jgi:hypothetical protein
MTDMRNQEISDWDAVRARWRRAESELRAPNDLVDRSFAEFELERRVSRNRATLAGLSVAASLLVLVGAWTLVSGDRAALKGVQSGLPTANAPDPATPKEGPCVDSGSCIDLVQVLASIDSDALLERDAPGIVGGVYTIPNLGPD